MADREDELDEARVMGRDAALRGDAPDACPYPMGSGEGSWWQAQYDLTRREMELGREGVA